MNFKTSRAVFFTLLFLITPAWGQNQRKEEREADKYYQKWMDQDVLFLITDEEREVFKKLSTADEKDQFIEQFWQRRDTDLTTAINEYKEEHYRRLAYVNQKFGSGIPGWKTDRGRTYIMYGPADEIEYYAGGNYLRKPWEGGGRTATFPFEIWYYNYLPGVGGDIELEFVDRSFSGEFKLAIYPWEKDMLLHVDGLGQTNAERFGLADRAQRPGLHPGNLNNLSYMKKFMGARTKDLPFERQLQYFRLQKPPQIKQKELQKIIDTRVIYDVLPFSVYVHHLWIGDRNALVPITLEVRNSELTYIRRGDFFKARVGIYGRITSMRGELITEFEETLASEYRAQYIEAGRTQKSVFQKIAPLEPGRYKIELVVKDLGNSNVGTFYQGIHIPVLMKSSLTTSSLVLADQLQPLDDFPDTPTSFVLGDVRVVPNVTGRFEPDDELGVYLQVHNAGIDSSTSLPDVQVEYVIRRGNEVISRVTDTSGSSIEYISGERLVLVRKIKIESLKEGRYEMVVIVNDSLTGQKVENKASFEIVG